MNSSPGAAIPAQDLYQLNQYIQVYSQTYFFINGASAKFRQFQEALAREQFLESKLLSLQRLIGDTEMASSQGWRALMDEDRLLTRFTIFSLEDGRKTQAHAFFSGLRFWKAS